MKSLKSLKALTLLLTSVLPVAACGDDAAPTETEGTTGDDDDDTDPSMTSPSTTINPSTTTVDPSTTTMDPSDTDPTTTGETETATEPTTTGETESETETTMGPTTSETDSSGSSSSSGGPGDCIQVTPDAELTAENGQFYFNIADYGVDAAGTEDQFRVEFWSGDTGSFDLASAGLNDNYETCSQCVRMYGDTGPTPTGPQYFDDPQYFQVEGTIDIDETSDPQNGSVSFTLTGVRLIEVTVNPDDAVSTPVEDGDCIDIADGTYGTPVIEGWTCNQLFFGDGDCDCGCGVTDSDCADMTVESCEFCNDEGSCDITGAACPGIIDPDNNAVCDTTPPAGWTCEAVAYADGTCDCGCGVIDALDCADFSVESCVECNGTGSCAEGGADCSAISPVNNPECVNDQCVDQSESGALEAGDLTYNRPTAGSDGSGCGPSGVGTDVSYDVYTFTAAGGSTNVSVSTCDAADFDSVVAIYQADDGSASPFDSADGCSNLVGYGDDNVACGGNTSLVDVVGLVDGEYQIVVTSFDNGVTGDYTMTATCF